METPKATPDNGVEDFERANCSQTPKLKALVLVTDSFGGAGGIAKFNRDFLKALEGAPAVERVYVLPRHYPETAEDPVPESIAYDTAAAGGKFAFMKRALMHGFSRNRIDLVICGHLHLLPAAWLLSRLCKARLALVVHGIEAWTPSKSILANYLAGPIDQVIAVSQYTAERFASWSGVQTPRFLLLPNCVDLDCFQPMKPDQDLIARYQLQKSKVILTLGRLVSAERCKGFDEVINVLPDLLLRFPTLKYLIVGTGPDLPRLKDKVAAKGVSEAVVFTGYIPESEKAAHYNLADAYVMPSSGEGFGIVFIEAAACGVPAIGSLADGSREALLGGRLGILVDPRKPDELIKAITRVLDDPPPRARIRAVEKFSVASFRARVAGWALTQALIVAERKTKIRNAAGRYSY
jgi:phosphatidyl-myo-inositol dimannoside synthase